MKAPHVLVICAAVATCASAQTPKTLRLKLTPGKTYRYALSLNSPKGMMGPMSQNLDLLLKVQKKTAEVYHIEAQATPAKTADQKEAPKPSKFLATFNSRGTQLTMKAAGGGQPANLGGMNFGFMGLEFPVAPVRVGSTWSMSHDIKKIMSGSLGSMAGQMDLKGGPLVVKYTVAKISGNLMTINSSYSGKMELSMKQNKQAQPMKMTISGTGAAVVDTTTGLQTQSTMTVTSEMTSPMKASQKVTITLKLK